MKDIIIIGAGPAGISMAVEAVNAGISTDKILILEKSEEHSFTIKNIIRIINWLQQTIKDLLRLAPELCV